MQQGPGASSEIIVYLNVASHELSRSHRTNSTSASASSAKHTPQLVVSLPVLENLDAALAALIAVAPA